MLSTSGSRGQGELLEALLATGTPVSSSSCWSGGRKTDLCPFALPMGRGRLWLLPRRGGRRRHSRRPERSGQPVRSPSGQLPDRGGGQPGTYVGAPLAQASRVSSVDPTPLFPFGHGLSYVPVTWLAVEQRLLPPGRPMAPVTSPWSCVTTARGQRRRWSRSTSKTRWPRWPDRSGC